MPARLLSDQRYFHGKRANLLYELLGWKFRHATDVRFMNYGYAFDDIRDQPDLHPEDEAERYCAQLYHVVASQVDLTGKNVIDVGAGRGGGASFVHRYHGPSRTIGIELAHSAVSFCQMVHAGIDRLLFKRGDATALPFADGEIDAVLNVESAHCYPDAGKFLAEAHRVLVPGGSLLFADFVPRGVRMDAAMRVAGFEQVAFRNITDGVVHSLDLDDARRVTGIRESFPYGTRRLACLWAGTRDSWIFRDFIEGRRDYVMYRATKAS